jgi:hypothetical protein
MVCSKQIDKDELDTQATQCLGSSNSKYCDDGYDDDDDNDVIYYRIVYICSFSQSRALINCLSAYLYRHAFRPALTLFTTCLSVGKRYTIQYRPLADSGIPH